MPEDARPLAVITIGYANEHPPRPLKYTLDNITYIERWGTRIKDFAAYLGYYQHASKLAEVGKDVLQKFLEKWSK
jgi:hypothetical protein